MMKFAHVMKLIGAGLGAAAGVAVAVATLPVWVAPVLAGAAAVAGVLATSPLDQAAMAGIKEVAKQSAIVAPGNAKVAAAAKVTTAVVDAFENRDA